MRADAPPAPRRAVIEVTGAEARDFLNGLLTNSVLTPGAPAYAALLTPQGKILHTLFVHDAPDATEGGALLDVAADGADDLLRRLTMFRLRRKIGLKRRDDLGVALNQGAPDPRSPSLPARAVIAGAEQADWAAYDTIAIAAGVADQGRDFGPEEVFPHDVNMDLIHGVNMKKGCFVGQEVVSRMHRKGGVRKRICVIRFDGAPPAFGVKITDGGGADLGSVRSVDATSGVGLALVRVDRLESATAPVTADDHPISIIPPTT